jgi:hypothetical protein
MRDKFAHVCLLRVVNSLGNEHEMSVLVSSGARFGAEARLTFENAVCRPVHIGVLFLGVAANEVINTSELVASGHRQVPYHVLWSCATSGV